MIIERKRERKKTERKKAIVSKKFGLIYSFINTRAQNLAKMTNEKTNNMTNIASI